MIGSLQPEDFDRRARRHRECAIAEQTPNLVQFHEELASHLERLARESRDLLSPWLACNTS